MRILQLINSFDFGGAENHVCELANTMHDMGNEVFVVSHKGLQNKRLDPGVNFIQMKMLDLFIPFLAIYLCILLSRHRIDVIHAHKRISILMASLAGRIMKVPVVATIHGQPKYDLRSIISRIFTDRIIFVSKRTIDANLHLKKILKKSVFIQNGIRIVENKSERDYFSICYISRIDRRHSSLVSMIIIKVLPEIIKEFPGVTLNVLGDGEYLDTLRREADKFNRQNNREICKIHGYVPDVRHVIKGCGILLGVGRAAMEALACSVPVLSVNQIFMGEIVTKQNYEFYQLNNFVAAGHKPPEPELLTGLLQDYFRDPASRQDEAKILREIINKNLGIEKIAREIIDLYEESVKTGSGGRKRL